MQWFWLFLVGTAVGLCPVRTLAGDAPLEIGVSGGYIMPLHTGTFNFENYTDTIPAHSFTTGSGFRLGGTLVVPLESSGKWSLGVNMGVISHTSEAIETGVNFPIQISDSLTKLYVQAYHTFQYSAASLFCDIEASYKPLENSGFGGFFGLSGSYITSTSFRQTLHEVFDPNSPVHFDDLNSLDILKAPIIRDFWPEYTDETRTAILRYEGDTPNADKFQAYLRVGIFYDIPLGSLIISPSVSYQFPITTVTSSQSWRVHLLSGGVDVRVGL